MPREEQNMLTEEGGKGRRQEEVKKEKKPRKIEETKIKEGRGKEKKKKESRLWKEITERGGIKVREKGERKSKYRRNTRKEPREGQRRECIVEVKREVEQRQAPFIHSFTHSVVASD